MHWRLATYALLLAGISVGGAAPAPEEFGKLPYVHDAAIAPDGTQIAMFVNIDGHYGIRILSLQDKNEKLRFAFLSPGVKPQWIKWANDHQVLAGLWQSKIVDATPITVSYIYTMNATTLDGKILVEPKKILRQNNSDVIDFLEHDPDHILMTFSDSNQFISDLQRVHVVTGQSKRIKRGQKRIQQWYTDLRGEPRVGQGVSDLRSTTEAWTLMIRDAQSDDWRYSDDYPGLQADTDIFGFTSDPNELVIGQKADKQTTGLYVYDLNHKKVTRKLFHNDNYDALGLILSSDGKDIVGARFVADEPEIQFFGEMGFELDRLRGRFSDYTIDFVDYSRAGDLMICKMSSANSPGAIMLVNTGTGELSRLAMLWEGLHEDEMGNVTSAHYRARDGFMIPAYITLPRTITDSSNLKNVPFVVLPHGGPYARTSKRFDYFAQFFATRGFGVLQMNFRGSAGYGEAFQEAGRKDWAVMQEDVEDGTRWLMAKGYADPKRTCIAGWSYGGYAALMGAINHPDLYACAISMAGVTDLKDLVYDIGKYRFGRQTAKKFVLDGFSDKRALKDNSPAKRASELTVPLFLAHGEADQRVHFDQFTRMKAALRKSPAEVTYMEFPDEDHFLSNQKNRQEFFKGLDRFLATSVGQSEFKQ